MKTTTILRLAAITTLLAPAEAAIAQDSDKSYMLQMTRIEVKVGHSSAFRDGFKAYMDCYEENDGQRNWSVWNNVDGSGDVYHLVSRRENWAELDTRDAASRECWSTIEESVAPHVTSVSSSFARHLPAWSGQAENYNVVRLHQFRVDESADFRETVGTIAGILKDSDYEHPGTWYSVIGSSSSEYDYFVVEHYENFAAMDDRVSVHQALVNAVGQERTTELWDAFGDSLYDDAEYGSELLVRVPELSRTADD